MSLRYRYLFGRGNLISKIDCFPEKSGQAVILPRKDEKKYKHGKDWVLTQSFLLLWQFLTK